MRLFIAIELPKSFRAEVGRIQRAVQAASTGGRFVPAGNHHITLHFIGESRDLAGVAGAMGEAVRGIRPFTLHLGGVGSFVRSDGHTPYLTVLGQLDELNALHESLEAALSDAGFARDRKRYVPHITLGRGVQLTEADLAGFSALQPMASLMARELVLYASVSENGRMAYQPLHRARF